MARQSAEGGLAALTIGNNYRQAPNTRRCAATLLLHWLGMGFNRSWALNASVSLPLSSRGTAKVPFSSLDEGPLLGDHLHAMRYERAHLPRLSDVGMGQYP
jgi:hypothetical protein